MTNPHRITTIAEVESIVGQAPSVITLKVVGALDEGCRDVLAHCPIAGFGYRDADGVSRTTFIGGTPGFVHVHSPTRVSFVLPEGEPHGAVSFVFLLPGVGEVLRVNGTVARRAGPETFVDVAEAYVHCAQAVIRSRLWQPPAPTAQEPTEPAGDGPLRAPGVAEFLAASSFLVLSTWDSVGGSDTSPRGDQPTVARVLDGQRLLIADRKGNKRADSLHNLVQDDRLSFAALVRGRSGVLHGRGRAVIVDDPELLATVALRGGPPHAGLLIDVEHAEITGSDAVARSRIWVPTTHLSPGTAPDLNAVASVHLAAGMAAAERGVLARVLRVATRLPGVGRLMRTAMDRTYRSTLEKEGYADVDVRARRPGGTDAPAAAHPLREVRVAEVRRETSAAVTLVLEDADRLGSFDFRPGQFFTLVADVDGRPVRRAYSATSPPGTTRLEVTIKQVTGGRFSPHVHQHLRGGDRLALRGPSGDFHVDPATAHELVLVAAGSGVTPMMSMIRTLLAAPTGDRIALLFSNRTTQDIIFADELRRLAEQHPQRLSVTHVLTQAQGRLDAAGVRNWLADLRPGPDARFYMCGPDALMDTVGGVLAELDVPHERVHRERYASGADLVAPITGPQRMTVADGAEQLGTTVVEPGQTLLDAGLAAGLPMPFSCTVGNCGECMVQLRSGEVTTTEPNCLPPRQRADGYTLTCVSCPLSAVTLDIAPVPLAPARTARGAG